MKLRQINQKEYCATAHVSKIMLAACLTMNPTIISGSRTYAKQKQLKAISSIEKITPTGYGEGAWARGPRGLTIGFKRQFTEIDLGDFDLQKVENQDNQQDIETSENDLKGDKFAWNGIEFAKGLMWPFDLLGSFAFHEPSSTLKWNTSIQHSIFQEPFYPSVAYRIGFSNGQKAGLFTSQSYETKLLTSWGYQSVEIHGNYGLHLTNVSVSEQNRNKTSSTGTTQLLGFSLKLNPLSKISFSKTWTDYAPLAVEVKFAVGL